MADSNKSTLRQDDQYVAHLVRHSKSRRGKLLSGDKYFNPQSVGLVWVNPSDRVFTLNGSQVAVTSLSWSDLFDTGSVWAIDFTISSYVAGQVVISNTEYTSSAITANGNYLIELVNSQDFDLSFSANDLFNGSITINTIKRLS